MAPASKGLIVGMSILGAAIAVAVGIGMLMGIKSRADAIGAAEAGEEGIESAANLA